MLRTADVKFVGISPLTQSKYYNVPKLGNERPAEYEKRTWKLRWHVDEATGKILIPQTAFKNSLVGAANFLGKKIPGRGQKTYSSIFKAACMVFDPVILDYTVDDLMPYDLFVPSDGKPGSGKRVMKTFGSLAAGQWEGVVRYNLFEETITEEVFREHVVASGSFVGLGMFRPERNGFYGRFRVEDIKWTTHKDASF